MLYLYINILLLIIFITYTSDGLYTYKSYQGGIVCVAHSPPYKPTKPCHIQSIVKSAIEKNLTVKVIGNLHSVTDNICTSGYVVNLTHFRNFSYDKETKRATVGAGAYLMDVMGKLHEHNRALQSAPTYGHITIGGAIGTGAHGSSLKYPGTISDQLFSIKAVDGRGRLICVNVTQQHFKAFKVNLGLLAIIYEVELMTVSDYKLSMVHYVENDNILWRSDGKELIDLARSHDVFQFWWFPLNKEVVLALGNRTSIRTQGTCETHFISETSEELSKAFSQAFERFQTNKDHLGMFTMQTYAKASLHNQVPGRSPFYTEDDGSTACLPSATGYAYKMMTNTCHDCFWKHGNLSLIVDDSNVAIPLDQFYPALQTIYEILQDNLVEFPLNGIFFRFLTKSDSFMGINSERETVSIEWITIPRFQRNQAKLGITAYQAMGQTLMHNHKGRAHWGKNGLLYHHPDFFHQSYPTSHIIKFLQVIDRYDPKQVFINNFGMRVRFKLNSQTLRDDMREQCALNEACYCDNDQDCSSRQELLDYSCEEAYGYRVCKEQKFLLDKDIATRQAIEILRETFGQDIDKIIDAVNNIKEFSNKMHFIGPAASTSKTPCQLLQIHSCLAFE